jgi:hypothetical protein
MPLRESTYLPNLSSSQKSLGERTTAAHVAALLVPANLIQCLEQIVEPFEVLTTHENCERLRRWTTCTQNLAYKK